MNYFHKIALLLFALIFFSISESNAQDIKDYKKEFEVLADSIVKYIDSNGRLSLVYAKQVLALTIESRDTLKAINALHFIGRQNQFLGEYKESIKYFEQEIALLNAIDVERYTYQVLEHNKISRIEVLAQLGQNYKELGQFEKAFATYNKCIEIARKENLEFYNDIMPTLIADLHFTMGNYKEALIKHKESFKALETTKTISEATRIYNRGEIIIELSEIYLKLNQKDSALYILDEGFKEKLDTLSLNAKIGITGQKGRVYLARQQYDKALLYLLATEELAYEYDSVSAPKEVSLELGESYFNLKEYDKAIKILENGIHVKKQNSKEIYLTDDYKLLAKIYKASGNLEKSNEYYEKYILNQTALEKSKDTITSAFHTQEVSNLEKEKSTQKSTFYLFMSIGLGLLVLLITFIIYLIKEKKKNTEKFNVLLAKFSQEEKPTIEIIDTKDKVLEGKVSAEVNEETTYLILAGLQTLKEQEYFLRQDCNSYNVAKKIKTNTSYLSKVINSHFEKNFNTYINDLRINYAILRLKNDSRFRSFSVQSIAEEIGYKSADSFARYFKLRTGLNPSFYIKQLNSLD
ncbi:helix-turn-helix domain-containing protein [Aureibaculum algae]|uniref:Helix-turn-helix domain-containing protein n=1 Tax=Aureibaculum algae TaxID=2584122 RepID=A0A5B7TWL9_9FLAO|nr:AraC family transcriptional regulator [Aureibaculum algae]QCX40628.1 helix-turn-helix domain-containing protein [Aureibaculum algae]